MSNSIDLQINSKLDKISNDLFNSYEERVTRASIELHNQLVRNLAGQRGGNVYKLPWVDSRKVKLQPYKPGKQWTASSPGDFPAVRLGDLRTSYKFMTEGKGFDAVGMVGSPLGYALYLEKGLGMAPRPHLSRTFQENKEKITSYFKGLIE